MTNAETEDDPTIKQAKWTPRVITGGKGPPDPPDQEGSNWLADLETGTTFVTRSRNSKEVDLNLYHVLFKSLPGVVFLKWQLPDGKLLDYYVDPVRFSKMFEKPIILGVIKEEAAEADGDANGNSDRTNRQSDVVLHETVP